ncbi:hypothetical protein PIB30_014834 [Stylosanthes scabra]|uniref:Uncharacterized protein n=1 Tax=Stylosanthes scabra TaxID=79078 RepID=A0ABU6R753_9FABA|nr:hypothetical protein [Stylosanthes scabra]
MTNQKSRCPSTEALQRCPTPRSRSLPIRSHFHFLPHDQQSHSESSSVNGRNLVAEPSHPDHALRNQTPGAPEPRSCSTARMHGGHDRPPATSTFDQSPGVGTAFCDRACQRLCRAVNHHNSGEVRVVRGLRE